MSNNFSAKTTLRTPRPRSRRLRETGGTGGSVSAASQSSAVTDHNQLFGRESQGAHPMTAITGLSDFATLFTSMFERVDIDSENWYICAKKDLASVGGITAYATSPDISMKVRDLGDVRLSNLTNGDVLVWNSTTQKWENGVGGGGGSSVSWGTESGGTIQLTVESVTKTLLTQHQSLSDYYTKTQVDSALAGKADISSLSNYLPLTGGTLTGRLTIEGNENNEIKDVLNQDGEISNISVGLASIRHALSFKWYYTDWQLGNIRGWGLDSLGFGITKNNSVCVFRVNESAGYINENTIYHSGNCNNIYTDWNAKILNSYGVIYSNRYNASGNMAGAAFVLNKGGDYFGIGPSATNVNIISLGTVTNTTGTWKSEQITILNDGSVGIGTTSPSYKLDINGTLNAATIYQGGTALANIYHPKGGASGLSFIADTIYASHLMCGFDENKNNEVWFGSAYYGLGADTPGALIYTYNNYPIYFYAGGQERMRIGSGGNVGIGTTSPSYKLDVDGSLRADGATVLNSTLNVGGNTTIGGLLTVNNNAHFGNNTNGDYIKIGPIKLTYDAVNSALRVENVNGGSAVANLYATGGVSAYGQGLTTNTYLTWGIVAAAGASNKIHNDHLRVIAGTVTVTSNNASVANLTGVSSVMMTNTTYKTIRLTHDLGTTDYNFVATAQPAGNDGNNRMVRIVSKTANALELRIVDAITTGKSGYAGMFDYQIIY